MRNAIAYTRVSSRRQVDDGNSLDTQKQILTEYARRNNIKINKWFVEEGESAKTADRTMLKKMLEYSIKHKGENSLLLIYKVNRLARNSMDFYTLKETFAKCGLRVFSVNEHFEDTPIGRAMEGVTSIFAQLDNEQRAEVCKDGMVNAVREGRWCWPAPMGYVNGRDRDYKRNLVLDPRDKYVDILRSSWYLIATGSSETEARNIVNAKLKEAGYKEIPRNSFSRMLANKIYIGVIESFGLSIQSKTIPPMIEEETFYKVRDILSGNKNLGKKYIKHNDKYPLRGILYCKEGHKMTASSPKGRTKRYPKYHCPICRGEHTANYSVEEVDEKFLDYIKDFKMSRDIKEALKTAIELNLADTIKNNGKTRENFEKRLTEISAEKKEIVRKNLKGIVSDKTTQEMLCEYECEETEIRLKLNEMEDDVEDVEELMEFGVNKLSNLAETFKEIEDPEIRFRFQKWLFPAGLMYDGEKFGTTRIPMILQIKRTALAGVSSSIVPFGDPTGNRTRVARMRTWCPNR